MRGRKRIYPDRKWSAYWSMKRYHAKRGSLGHGHYGKERNRYSGVGFDLSHAEILELIESFPEEGGHPTRNGWQLGRIDHSKGYTRSNVRWEWYTENIREMQKRVRYEESILILSEHAFSYPLV